MLLCRCFLTRVTKQPLYLKPYKGVLTDSNATSSTSTSWAKVRCIFIKLVYVCVYKNVYVCICVYTCVHAFTCVRACNNIDLLFFFAIVFKVYNFSQGVKEFLIFWIQLRVRNEEYLKNLNKIALKYVILKDKQNK